MANPARHAPAIAKFLEQDQKLAPPKDGILFIGSSIFRQWKNLSEQMAPLPAYNRAFGGSQTHDILHYMDKVVLPYSPQVIVYYCGSNDVNAGKSATEIVQGYTEFVERVHARLPKTRILYASILKAPQKKDRWDVVDTANQIIESFSKSDPRLGFIQLNTAVFDRAGQPRLELYQKDMLHYLEPAYAEFTAVIRPVVERAFNQSK